MEIDQATFAELVSQPAIEADVDKLLDLSHDQAQVWELNNSDNIAEYID